MVPIATDPLHPAETDLSLYHIQGMVRSRSSLRGSEGLSLTLPRLPHPTELTWFSSVLALASSAIHTSIPLSVQYSCHTAGHFPSGEAATTHAPGGYTQQERSALAIIPCVRTLLQHSGPNTWAPAPTHTCPPHQTLHTKREYYHH